MDKKLMSTKAGHVRRWRKRNKDRIIHAMGGECAICGYNKCRRSLDLHHIDPSTKEFGIGNMTSNPASWNTTVKELRKCVLICSNCHGEVHAEVTDLPDDVTRFDERYADYEFVRELHEETMRKVLTKKCSVCEKLIPNANKTCSVSCAAKTRGRIDWDSIDLEAELKIKTYKEIAYEQGCSDVAVAKRAKKIGIYKKGLTRMDWSAFDLKSAIQSKTYKEIASELGFTEVTIANQVKKQGLKRK